ncbi:hypothetical protein ACFQ14_01595 [Pseudahrensia aquimaris]|uniref:AAA domain-containing protein n=1 Tax=Pseudahrensia aquimaris TaxID=744461 RepID=A0ABW3F9F2_9HYPH
MEFNPNSTPTLPLFRKRLTKSQLLYDGQTAMSSRTKMSKPKRFVLLIAGPSGSGKSTFIQQLRDGVLPAEIRYILPQNCCDWPMIEGNDLLKIERRPSRKSALDELVSAAEIIAHYDSYFIRNTPCVRYDEDPAHGLWATAEQFAVVSVEIDHEENRAHLLKRKQLARKKSTASRIWASSKRLFGRRRKEITMEQMLENEELLDIWTAKWTAYLVELGTMPNCVLISKVKPDRERNGGFRLA